MGRKKIRTGNCSNGCKLPVHARAVCHRCYRKIHYEEHERQRRGATKHDLSPIGTIKTDKSGYARIKIDIGHGARDWVRHHKYVMEQKLGRKLFDYENVHHINGNKSDNSEKNLELWITKQPKGQRIEDLIEYAKWIILTYNK